MSKTAMDRLKERDKKKEHIKECRPGCSGLLNLSRTNITTKCRCWCH